MVPRVYNDTIFSGAGGIQMQQISDAPRLNCPRCDSSNTKFCYYNNYSLAQPRHFCKACKRYWTRGGSLRNIPVGGGCRKYKPNKKPHSVPMQRTTIRPPENSLPIPAADLCSLIFAMPSTDSNKLFFPGLDLDAHLFDLHQSMEGGYDDMTSEGFDLTKGAPPMEEVMYSLGGFGAAPIEPYHLNWNQAEVISYGWPEYNFSVAPLL